MDRDRYSEIYYGSAHDDVPGHNFFPRHDIDIRDGLASPSRSDGTSGSMVDVRPARMGTTVPDVIAESGWNPETVIPGFILSFSMWACFGDWCAAATVFIAAATVWVVLLIVRIFVPAAGGAPTAGTWYLSVIVVWGIIVASFVLSCGCGTCFS